jgi:hypothetical protein
MIFWRLEIVMTRLFILIATLLCAALLVVAAAPADGVWNNVSPGAGGPLVLNLVTNSNTLSGTSDGGAISAGKAQGQTIWFNAVRGSVVYSYKGTVSGNVLNLSETRLDGTGLRNLQFLHQ